MKDFIKDKYNFISFGVAIIPSVLLWIFQPTDTVPYSLFAITALICMFLLWAYLMTYFHYCDSKDSNNITIIRCMNDLILCRPAKGVNVNTIVTIYECPDQYENILGYGYVQNIQQNGIIQIAVINSLIPNVNNSGLVQRIDSNLSIIIIKTIATIDTLKKFK